MKYDLALAVALLRLPVEAWAMELEKYPEPRRARIENTARLLKRGRKRGRKSK